MAVKKNPPRTNDLLDYRAELNDVAGEPGSFFVVKEDASRAEAALIVKGLRDEFATASDKGWDLTVITRAADSKKEDLRDVYAKLETVPVNPDDDRPSEDELDEALDGAEERLAANPELHERIRESVADPSGAGPRRNR